MIALSCIEKKMHFGCEKNYADQYSLVRAAKPLEMKITYHSNQ